jgi:LytS/YehU family sensor histidine kinase
MAENERTDNGTGTPETDAGRGFFSKRKQLAELTRLRRQLRELFGKPFKLEMRSEVGVGTTATLALPLQISPAGSPE